MCGTLIPVPVKIATREAGVSGALGLLRGGVKIVLLYHCVSQTSVLLLNLLEDMTYAFPLHFTYWHLTGVERRIWLLLPH